MVRAWTRSSSLLFNSFIEANRAAVAAFGVSSTQDGRETAQVAPGSDLDEWEIDRSLRRAGYLSVGDSIRFSKSLSGADVAHFAAASGDTNPLHLDVEHAEQTRFGGPIVHGALLSGLISGALARFPGDIIYLSQESTFLRPVSVGERATAVVEVVEELGNNRYRLRTQLLDVEGETAIDGEATVLVD